jgi:hypothetical protein
MKAYNKISFLAVIIGAVIIFGGCNPVLIPFKGQYSASPLEITSAKSVDSIWLDINRLFTEKGLPIKKIEKEKGMIVSTKTSFMPAYTFEDANGKLIEPEAWIVLEETYLKKKKWNPKKIFCQWNIQITQLRSGISAIKVDPVVMCTWYPNMFATMQQHCQSTGKLEELLGRTL